MLDRTWIQIYHICLYFLSAWTSFSFYLIGYYQGVPNGVCNDVNDVIRMKQICLEAIEALTGVTDSKNMWSGKFGKVPQGCSIRDGGDLKPHFELSDDGLGTGRKDLIPICYKNGKSFSRNLLYY